MSLPQKSTLATLRHLAMIAVSWIVGSGAIGWLVADVIVHEHGSIIYFLGILFIGLIAALIHIVVYLVSSRMPNGDADTATRVH